MILLLHNRYRTTGGEERVVEDIAWLVREHLGEDAEVLERDSATLGAPRAAIGLLRGGLDPEDVAAAVRRTRARVVHAHNLNPAFGWRALAAARRAGARVVLHLHNYRLVCAVGTCFNTDDEDCTRCQGRNTLPGVRLNCRRTGRAEAAVYAAGLAAHQRRVVGQADAVVVPSVAAAERLRALDAPLGPAGGPRVIPHVVRRWVDEARPAPAGPALVVSRLAVEKGVDLAIEACAMAGVPLVVAGDGPERDRLRALASERGGDVTWTGRAGSDELVRLRAAAGVALVPTRAWETFGLAAVEAMAAGLPVAATAAGALRELDGVRLVAPGDAAALGEAVTALRGDREAARRGLSAARQLAAPEAVAPLLRSVYDGDH